MQNAGIQALGLDWLYLAFDVHPDKLGAAIGGAKAMKFIGLNLTVPHKLPALQMVEELDESAKTWGAVNTIRFEARGTSGRWQPLVDFPVEIPEEIRARGYNTDADAIARALREDLGVDPQGASVLLLGAGGAGRTAALKLASEGVGKLFLINRTERKAEGIAGEIRNRFPRQEVTMGYPKAKVDLVMNTTSLGLKSEDPLPFDPKQFSLSHARAVFDMVYLPAETPLLRAAKGAGCRTADGLGMLLYQGAKALEIWSGRTAPLEVMRLALEKRVHGN